MQLRFSSSSWGRKLDLLRLFRCLKIKFVSLVDITFSCYITQSDSAASVTKFCILATKFFCSWLALVLAGVFVC